MSRPLIVADAHIQDLTFGGNAQIGAAGLFAISGDHAGDKGAVTITIFGIVIGFIKIDILDITPLQVAGFGNTAINHGNRHGLPLQIGRCSIPNRQCAHDKGKRIDQTTGIQRAIAGYGQAGRLINRIISARYTGHP